MTVDLLKLHYATIAVAPCIRCVLPVLAVFRWYRVWWPISDMAASEVVAYLVMLLQMLPHGRDSTLTCSIRRVLPVLAVFRWYRVWRPIRSVSMILLHLKWWPTYSCCCRCCHNVSTDFRQIFTWFAYYYASDADCCNCCGMVRVSAGHECELCGSGWTDRCAVCTRNRVLVGGLDHPREKDTFESHTWGCPDLLWSILSVFFSLEGSGDVFVPSPHNQADGYVWYVHRYSNLPPFKWPLLWTACISRYQKGKSSLDLNEARDDGV